MTSDASRRRFAEELRAKKGLRSQALVEALARVPRERFVGPGPWLILKVPEGYTSSPNADPDHLYADVAVAIDAARLINNGSPGLVAAMLDTLAPQEGERVVHVGCGTGYYTALLAEIVGPKGEVLALELEPEFAERARENLRGYPQVKVMRADGTRQDLGRSGAILVSAGATHPRRNWLDALAPGARMLLPLTGVSVPGQAARFGRNLAGLVLNVTGTEGGYAARFVDRIGVSFCHGARDVPHERLLRDALLHGGTDLVASLRREPHDKDATCWLHAEDFCLSTRPPAD
jgi:protein-L-isoaspartate(D-aspartate) O-methyltransferase